MKINNAWSIINNNKGKPVSQTELGRALNKTKQAIYKRIKSNSELSGDEVNLLESYFNVNLSEPTPASDHENPLESFVTDTEFDQLVDVLVSDKVLLYSCIEAIQKHRKELKLFLAGLD